MTVASASACHAVRRQRRGRDGAVRHRIAGARIDDVRVVPAAALEKAAVVAGGGHARIVQRRRPRARRSGTADAAHRRAGRSTGDAPRRRPRIATARAQLARQVDEVVSDALRVEIFGDAIDAAALAERRQVHAHARRACARDDSRHVDFDTLRQPTRAARGVDGRRRPVPGASPGSGPKPQRFTSGPDGDVVGAAAALPRDSTHRPCTAASSGSTSTHSPLSIGVEAAQRGVGALGAERQIHGVEARLHAGAQVLRRRGQRARRASTVQALPMVSPDSRRLAADVACPPRSGEPRARRSRSH